MAKQSVGAKKRREGAWEYQAVILSPGNDEAIVKRLIETLTPLGEARWELVGNVPRTNVFVLKRPVQASS
jgi:hypothetical protein